MNSFLQGIPYNLPCLQNECLQGFAVASIESYATRFSDLVKWINESHMFTRGYAKHPCKQIKYSQRVAVHPIRPYPREDQLGASQQTPKASQHLFHTGLLV
jgi:hypothetical protein